MCALDSIPLAHARQIQCVKPNWTQEVSDAAGCVASHGV